MSSAYAELTTILDGSGTALSSSFTSVEARLVVIEGSGDDDAEEPSEDEYPCFDTTSVTAEGGPSLGETDPNSSVDTVGADAMIATVDGGVDEFAPPGTEDSD